MRRVYALAERAAASDISVLILGETGVGKEFMAEAVYPLTPQQERLSEAQLCGTPREPARRRALRSRTRVVHGGARGETWVSSRPPMAERFLDEIGELPPRRRRPSFRVFWKRQTVMRIGSNKAKAVNVRFVTATNRSLDAEIRAGRFRRDLYYRISGMLLEIPPLRQRKSEIEPLARHFLEAFCRKSKLPPQRITDEALAVLREHTWPGNVRELRNVMERATLLAVDSVVSPETIRVEAEAPDSDPTLVNDNFMDQPPSSLSSGVPSRPIGHIGQMPPALGGLPDWEENPPSTRVTPRSSMADAEREAERQRILKALETCGGNQTRAAKLLNVSRRTLINRLEEFKLPRPRGGV